MTSTVRRLTVFASLFAIAFFLGGYTRAVASDRNRFIAKPGSVFCRSITAMHALQNSLIRKDGKATSILGSKDCSISPAEVIVYVVHDEKDIVRVQLPGSGKYFWISKQSLR